MAAINPTTSPAQTMQLLLDARTAAKLCGVSRSHFLAMHVSGRIPLPVRLGRRVLWRASELVDWTNAGCPSRERWLSMKGGAK